MPLVEAKCTSCGAILQVDDAKDAAICPFCLTPYVVEKAINNYNVTNNITAGVVNVIGGNSDFEIEAGVLKKYKGAATEVVIPDGVKEIGNRAFSGHKYLTSVTIPDSVINIDYKAFEGCLSLTNITIPSSVFNIAKEAFSSCISLKEISIPTHIKVLSSGIFLDCKSLINITIPDTVKVIEGSSSEKWSQRHYGAFQGCDSLTNISIPNSVTYIDDSTFFNCKGLTNISIPDSVTAIGKDAFWGCSSLVNITIPNSVTQIGRGAFYGCSNLSTIEGAEKLKKDIPNKFKGTLWYKNYENLREDRRSKKLCQYCGGEFKVNLNKKIYSSGGEANGFLKKVCSKCGYPKDY